MSKIKLDLNQFKHVKSDDKSTTLQHKQGHTLTIAHKTLGPEAQAQLKALAPIAKQAATPLERDQMHHEGLAEGGKVDKQPKKEPSAAEMLRDTPAKPFGRTTVVDRTPKAHNNVKVIDEKHPDHDAWREYFTKKFAEGTPDEPVQAPAPEAKTAVQATPPPQVNPELDEKRQIYKELGGKSSMVWGAPGTMAAHVFSAGEPDDTSKDFDPKRWQEAEQTYANQQQLKAEGAQEEEQKRQFDSQQRQAAGLAPAIVQHPDGATQPAADINAPAFQTQPAKPPKEQPGAFAEAEGTFRQGLGQAKQGELQKAEAVGQLGKEQAQQYQQSIDSQQHAQNMFQQQYGALDQERKAHIQDIQNGYVDPEKYWDNHSKIATGIGMILAGFNPTSNPNAAINFFKTQMDQNLQAQAKNLDAKNNLLSANLHQFGNLHDAAAMTRIQMQDALSAQMAKAAAANASPVAKAQAEATIGHLNMDASQQLQQFAMRKMMMDIMNPKAQGNGQQAASDPNDPDGTGRNIRALDAIGAHDQADLLREQYVPGVGRSATGAKVPEDVKKQIIAHKAVNDLMNMSLEFTKKYGGSHNLDRLNPAEREKVTNQAATIQNQLIGQIKQAQHDGVYKLSEADFLIKQIGGSPSGWMANWNSVPQIRQMQAIKQSEYNRLLGGYGLPQQKLPQEPGEAETKTFNGAKYQKVHGGWKKVQ